MTRSAPIWVRPCSFASGSGPRGTFLLGKCCQGNAPTILITVGFVPERGHAPFLFMNPKHFITMIVPSTKQMLLFFTVNFTFATVYNILLLKNIDFITHVIFGNILAVNTLKIGMLVSVFILTVFIINLLFFALFLKNDFKRSLLSAARISMGVFTIGVIIAGITIFVNRF